MGSTLQNGWRDRTQLPAMEMGPVIWRGQHRMLWNGGASGKPPATVELPAPVSDDALLVEQARVDAEAFGALYDRYCDRIYRYVFRRLRNHEAAEDVTAEIFLKV